MEKERFLILDTHFIGEITEREVAIEFLRLGYMVSKPLVQSSRYDFIVDIHDMLYKIQVKTSQQKDQNWFAFATSTSHTNAKGTTNKIYSENEVDYFATMFNHKCYLIPYKLCGHRSQRLRLTSALNNQVKGILFAKDYELSKTIGRMFD